MNYSFAIVLCVSESVKDIFRLHACRQDSSLFPHLLITTWPSTTADYALRGAAVVISLSRLQHEISLRRLHSEERSRCWDQSPQTAQRGTGRGSRQNS
ncbi:hypothetical protein J6590_082708 [Homalodisca vitripennis]|nr:hypothetical protein J6590_082708 [Homalodisca vitripennis]